LLGAFIIGQTKGLTDYVHRSCVSIPDLQIYQGLEEYPGLHHLVRLLNAYTPRIVFVEIDQGEQAFLLARDVRATCPDASLIGFGHKVSREQLARAAASGIPEILQGYFSEQDLRNAIIRAIDADARRIDPQILAFMPAKGGSGATTVALNIAGALAGRFQHRVLLMEADAHSGPLSVLLDQNPKFSLADALRLSQQLDDATWSQLVTNVQGIDVLFTPRDGRLGGYTPWDCQRLISFCCTHYDTIIIDLPDVITDLTEPFVSRATQVMVVSTPEMASLFMAQRRLLELDALGVHREHLGVLLNRHSTDDVSVREIEQYFEMELPIVVPEDRAHAREAAFRTCLVDPKSPLGRSVTELAGRLAGVDEKASKAGASSLVRNVLSVFDRRLDRVHT
jgi:pilus assembly protein CpaE